MSARTLREAIRKKNTQKEIRNDDPADGPLCSGSVCGTFIWAQSGIVGEASPAGADVGIGPYEAYGKRADVGIGPYEAYGERADVGIGPYFCAPLRAGERGAYGCAARYSSRQRPCSMISRAASLPT